MALLREKLLAEFIGTFFLVLTIGVSVAAGTPQAALAIGIILAIQIYTFGSVSGACFNPAVTVAVLLSGRGKMSPVDAALYCAVQIGGALIAGIIAFGLTEFTFYFDYAIFDPGPYELSMMKNTPWTRASGFGTSFFLEVFFTMALCGAVLSTGTSCDTPNHYFGFAIGGTVTAGATACGGFDQGSFNPAVTIGINIANYFHSNSLGNPSPGAWILYLFAPLVGAVLAVGVFRITRKVEYEAYSKAAPKCTE